MTTGADALEGGDLPVDVQHLRLQKCRAIRGDDGARMDWRNVQRPTLNAQRRTFKRNFERLSRRQISKKLDPGVPAGRHQKLCEEPDALPFSGRSMSTCCSAVPYFAGAFGFNICSGFPPAKSARNHPCASLSRRIGAGRCAFACFLFDRCAQNLARPALAATARHRSKWLVFSWSISFPRGTQVLAGYNAPAHNYRRNGLS